LCRRRDPAFDTLRADVEPLTPDAVRFRYPGIADPRLEAVRAAQEVVAAVRLFVVPRLPPGRDT